MCWSALCELWTLLPDSWCSGLLLLQLCGGQAEVHLQAVLRLQAGSDAKLSLLTAAHEAAAVTGQLLPGAPAVLWPILLPAGKEELHLLAEAHLLGE